MTPIEVAKELIKEKVQGGESLFEIQSSYMGRVTSKWWAAIGGWHNNQIVPSDKIVVLSIGGQEMFEIFDLKNIFNSVRKELNQLSLF